MRPRVWSGTSSRSRDWWRPPSRLTRAAPRCATGRGVTPHRRDKGWLTGLASLPYDLRGDAEGLPRFAWAGHSGLGRRRARVPALPGGGRRARDRRGAAAGVRGSHPGTSRPASHGARVGDGEHTADHLPLPRRGPQLAPVIAPGPWADLPPVEPTPQNPRTAEEVRVDWPTLDHRGRRAALLGPAGAVLDAVAARRAGDSGPGDDTSQAPGSSPADGGRTAGRAVASGTRS